MSGCLLVRPEFRPSSIFLLCLCSTSHSAPGSISLGLGGLCVSGSPAHSLYLLLGNCVYRLYLPLHAPFWVPQHSRRPCWTFPRDSVVSHIPPCLPTHIQAVFSNTLQQTWRQHFLFFNAVRLPTCLCGSATMCLWRSEDTFGRAGSLLPHCFWARVSIASAAVFVSFLVSIYCFTVGVPRPGLPPVPMAPSLFYVCSGG